MWFGFDWQSKAAVVVVMTFFPMLVNTIAGLDATGAMERDLMRSYGAGYAKTFVKVRLPNALPFIFNALKINSTLALIGAIVAEFFRNPDRRHGLPDIDRRRTHEHRYRLGDHRGGRARGIGILRPARAARTQRHLLARVLSPEAMTAAGEPTDIPGNREGEPTVALKRLVLLGAAGGARAVGRDGGGEGQGHAAAQMGHAGPVRRLFRGQGQGLLRRCRPRRGDQSGRTRYRRRPR